MHDLPIECMNEEMRNEIGKTIREAKKCDVGKDGSYWGMALRVLIKVNLKKPINRGRTINVLGIKYWIPLTFKKLLRIFLGCRRIIYGEGRCEEGRETPNSSSDQYGLWLKEAFENRSGRRHASYGF